jgi:enoyl-CoA hydratase/carnithine racemase
MIDLQVHDQIHVLRMQDGENRFNRASLDAFNAALDRVEQSDFPSALVTCGEGKFYSNGLDLDWMAGAGQAAAIENVQRVHELLGRLLTFPLVTVAAINGHAFAAGAMLTLAHDFRVMRSDRGYFCLPEVDLQIPFTPTMNALILTRMPNTTAQEAMVTGRRYGAQQALERGIVSQVESEAEVLPKAIALAKSLAGKHRPTLATIKRAAYAEVLRHVAADRAKPTALI